MVYVYELYYDFVIFIFLKSLFPFNTVRQVDFNQKAGSLDASSELRRNDGTALASDATAVRESQHAAPVLISSLLLHRINTLVCRTSELKCSINATH